MRMLMRLLCLVVGVTVAAGPACGSSRQGAEAARAEEAPTQTPSEWPIPSDPHAKRVYYENYEDGKCDRIRPSSSAAVVSREQGADVFRGKFCLRGNYDPKTTDPITRKKGTKGARMKAISLDALGVKDRFYVSYWWRLDAENKFVSDPPGFGGQKHAYITSSAAPWMNKVNCVVGQAWGRAHWWIVNNSPDPKKIPYHGEARVSPEQARLGVWHHVEFYLRLNSAPRERDGLAFLKIDGKLTIDMRKVPFIHTVPQTWQRMALPSMFGGGNNPKESFGWQLDELEIWDGLPPAEEAKPAGEAAPDPAGSEGLKRTPPSTTPAK